MGTSPFQSNLWPYLHLKPSHLPPMWWYGSSSWQSQHLHLLCCFRELHHSLPWLSLETLASSSLLPPLTSKHHKNNSERTAFPALQVSLLSSAASISLYSQASPKNHLHTLSLFSHLPLTPQFTLLGFHPQKSREGPMTSVLLSPMDVDVITFPLSLPQSTWMARPSSHGSRTPCSTGFHQ